MVVEPTTTSLFLLPSTVCTAPPPLTVFVDTDDVTVDPSLLVVVTAIVVGTVELGGCELPPPFDCELPPPLLVVSDEPPPPLLLVVVSGGCDVCGGGVVVVEGGVVLGVTPVPACRLSFGITPSGISSALICAKPNTSPNIIAVAN